MDDDVMKIGNAIIFCVGLKVELYPQYLLF